MSSVASIPVSLAWAHPIVQEWFAAKFGTPTEPQEQGWPHILAGATTLISAPTGSGKTLTAFLACIDQLVRKALSGGLRDQIEVVYISPLKALGNDIQKNLEAPLAEISQLAAERGFLMPPIRTFVRSGDTLPKDRQRMLKRPPHILVTTPESLYILLTAEKSRALLKCVRTVIVDEIHAIADDKRGSHLALSLERLDALVTAENDPLFRGVQSRPQRVGLSATQKPIELVAKFLTGSDPALPAPVIVDVGHCRTMDLAVEIPQSELGAVTTNQMWEEINERLRELIGEHRSTLIFVNTRAMAERLSHSLNQQLSDDEKNPRVLSHHGSLSRKIRLNAENRLKRGEIKALVATASLELGIDIGSIDLVCQIGTCRSIAVLLQRAGRAGHWRGAVPKGRIFATTRDELIECAALIRAIRSGDLDQLEIPDAPLDILAQQIVAMCAAEAEGWREDELLVVIRRAYPYRDLSERDYEDVLTMLSDGISAKRGRYGAYLQRDRVHGIARARRGSRLVAVTNGGAIPDSALFTVIAEPEGAMVATLDEDFAIDSSPGDVILLGNTSWRIRRIESKGRVLVEDAHGAPPTIPFWRGEAPQRTPELSRHVGEIRQTVSDLTPDLSPGFVKEQRNHEQARAATDWLTCACAVNASAAEQITDYIITGRAVLGGVPTQNAIYAERFFDEGGGMQLVIHAPFGGRILKAWGLALRKKFCTSFNFELQAAATDNGLNIALAEQHSFVLSDAFQYIVDESAQQTLEQASLDSPIFASRWRWNAGRALALLRYRGGKKVAPQIQRIQSDDLLASVFPDLAACQENVTFPRIIPDHPLLREVMKDVLHEGMDLDGLRGVLRAIATGEIRCYAVDTPVPSVFSHEILNSNPYAYLDDAPLEERRARAVQMRHALPESVLREIGGLDPAAIAQVREEAWPDVRDAHDLHDALLTLIAIPEAWFASHRDFPRWAGYFAELCAQGRAARCSVDDAAYWTIAERARTFRSAYPAAIFETTLAEIERNAPAHDDAMLAIVNGWLQHTAVITAADLAVNLALPTSDVERALLRLQASGTALQGSYTPSDQRPANAAPEWCDRRLLARVHRMTVASLRKQIEPVTAAVFMRWLLHWQHLAPGSQLSGERGLLELIRQMQGFEAPASAWERHIFSPRMNGSGYDPRFLDQLCLTGAVGWGRLSPHPAARDDSSGNTQQRRIVPTSVAPLTFFLRDDAEWMHAHAFSPAQRIASLENCLSPAARSVFEKLSQRGALFFAELVRLCALPKSEVETALWELIAAGLVTADGFENLRSLIDPKRKLSIAAPRKIIRFARPRDNAGRWSLLWRSTDDEEPAQDFGQRDRAIVSTCNMLLNRYGVVFRELTTRESNLPRWRELLICFRRMEDRGEIRGGRFVSGLLGEQFALPQALDSLRAMRSKSADDCAEITISAADPLNLAGILVPGERVPAISGRTVSFRNGVAASPAENAAGAAVATS